MTEAVSIIPYAGFDGLWVGDSRDAVRNRLGAHRPFRRLSTHPSGDEFLTSGLMVSFNAVGLVALIEIPSTFAVAIAGVPLFNRPFEAVRRELDANAIELVREANVVRLPGWGVSLWTPDDAIERVQVGTTESLRASPIEIPTRALKEPLICLDDQLAWVLNLPQAVEPEELASRIAQKSGWREPSQPETVEILVSLCLHVTEQALNWGQGPFHFVGVLFALDISELNRTSHWRQQVIAAQDLGILEQHLSGHPVGLATTVGDCIPTDAFWSLWDGVLGTWADDLLDAVQNGRPSARRQPDLAG
jgi:hypothetical protein